MFPENVSKNFDKVRQIAFSDLPIEEKMRLFESFDEVEVLFKGNIKYARNCFIPIDGFDEYAVSPFGDVISSKGDRIRLLSQGTESSGYLKVNLWRNGKIYNRKVHKLVSDAFLQNPYQMPQVNHIDGNKENNRLDNLEYCTREENIQHAYRTGLHSKRGRLTDEELNQIVDMINAGVIYREIANMFNIGPTLVKYIATGRLHKKVYERINVPEKTNAKKVRCIETGKIYESQTEAAIDLNISKGYISDHLKGKYSRVKGYHFEKV